MDAQEFARYNADLEREWELITMLGLAERRNDTRLMLADAGSGTVGPNLSLRWLELQRVTAQMYGGHSWAGQWMQVPCGSGGRFLLLNGRIGLGQQLIGHLDRILGDENPGYRGRPRRRRQASWAGFVLLHELTHSVGGGNLSELRGQWHSHHWLVPRLPESRTINDVLRVNYFYEAHIDLAAEVFYGRWLELLGVEEASALVPERRTDGAYRQGRLFMRGFLERIAEEIGQPLHVLLADLVSHGSAPMHYSDIFDRVAQARGASDSFSSLTIAGQPAQLSRRLVAVASWEFNRNTVPPGWPCCPGQREITSGRKLAEALIDLIELAASEPQVAKAEIDALAPRQENEAIATMRWLSRQTRPEQHAFLWALFEDRNDATERVNEWKVLLEHPEAWSVLPLDEVLSIRTYVQAQGRYRLRKLGDVMNTIAQGGDPVARAVLDGIAAPPAAGREAVQLA